MNNFVTSVNNANNANNDNNVTLTDLWQSLPECGRRGFYPIAPSPAFPSSGRSSTLTFCLEKLICRQMSSSSQEEIAVNLPMIRKMERICRFLSQIQKKLSQIQTFFCHRFKHFFQHRSNHALDIHFLLLLLYD